MDLPLNQDLLYGRWVRGEESGTETVYRPADYPDLPPSRGRKGFEFKPDGTYKRIGIGPTDVSEVTEGTWRIDPAHPDQIRIEVGGQEDVLTIQDLAPDRLAIQKSP